MTPAPSRPQRAVPSDRPADTVLPCDQDSTARAAVPPADDTNAEYHVAAGHAHRHGA